MSSLGQDRFTGSIHRRNWFGFDWPLLIIVLLLCALGAVNLYSACVGDQPSLFTNQLIYMGIGLAALFAAFIVPYRRFEAASYFIYAASIVLLIAVLVFGKVSHGAQRWLAIGPFSFQPSELTKITMTLALARYFSTTRNYKGYSLKELVIPIILAVVPVGLIALQDLGTAMIHIFIFVSVLLFVRIKLRYLILTVLAGVVSIPLGWFYALKDYQKGRVLTLLDPSRDPLGAGYHIRQSIIAVGSGEIFGKGYLHGTQTKLQFLPEHHTDFIFSVFTEEWGFVGSMVLVGLFFLMIFMGLSISNRSTERYGNVLAFGLTSILFWHVGINMLMVMGLAPVVGVTLPFMSYGGTSLIVMMVVAGLLLNVSARRYMFQS